MNKNDLLGTMTDQEWADRFGCGLRTAEKLRKKLGIPSFKSTQPKFATCIGCRDAGRVCPDCLAVKTMSDRPWKVNGTTYPNQREASRAFMGAVTAFLHRSRGQVPIIEKDPGVGGKVVCRALGLEMEPV